MSRWLRVSDACMYAKCSRSTLWRWRSQGLPFTDCNGIRIDQQELDNFIRRHSAAVVLRRHGMTP